MYLGGKTFIGLQVAGTKPGGTSDGQLTATNMATNKTAWQIHFAPPAPTDANTQTDSVCSGGTLTTAGGLVVAALPEGVEYGIAAFDAWTGTELWRFPTDAGIEAPPMTFGVGGTQYLAVYAGGRNTAVAPFTHGDSLYVFALAGGSVDVP